MVDWTGRPRGLGHPSCWVSSVSSAWPLPTVKWPRLLPWSLGAQKTGSRNFQDSYQTQHHFHPIPLFKTITDCSWPWGRPHACRKEGMDAATFQPSCRQAGSENCLEPKRSSLPRLLRKAPSLLLLGGLITKAAKSNLSRYHYLKYLSKYHYLNKGGNPYHS